jgi:N-acetylneuraminate lyase
VAGAFSSVTDAVKLLAIIGKNENNSDSEVRKISIMITHLKGLIPAPHTPMLTDGQVNLSAIENQAVLFRKNDIDAVYVCGSTGEGMSLTIEERISVVQRWQDVAKGDIKVLVNVGHTCLKDCRALAGHAAKAGAFAISAMPPFYFKPVAIDDLVEFYAGIAEAAPSLPFYAYHTPAITGVNFKMSQFLELASKRIPTLVGIKYNHTDLMDYAQCRTFANGRYDILHGVDETLLASLPYGTMGAIGSTYNYAAPLYYDLMQAYSRGEMERANDLQNQSIKIVQILLKYNVLAAGKSIMKIIGIDCGPVRLPVHNLTLQEQDQLGIDLQSIGFFDKIRSKI